METLAITLLAFAQILGILATSLATALVVVGPAFLIGSAVYKLATMPKEKIATRTGHSRSEMEARARIYEQQLKHRNNIR